MAKASDANTQTSASREMAIRQLVDRAVTSAGIVDILQAAGITAPDISILSDEFLAEMQQMEKKNLALEALKRLLNDEIRSRSHSNVTETGASRRGWNRPLPAITPTQSVRSRSFTR